MYLIGWGDTANSVWGEKAQGWLGDWVWQTGQTAFLVKDSIYR